MIVERKIDIKTGNVVYKITIPASFYDGLELDGLEKKVLSSPPKDVADIMQNLNILAYTDERRY